MDNFFIKQISQKGKHINNNVPYYKVTMKRILIGKIGVDSGSVMIIDPCYLNDAQRWNPSNLLKMAEEHLAKGEIDRANHTKRFAQEKTELQNVTANWSGFCEDAKQADHKPRPYASGIVSPTRNGDGEFPVYATFDAEGRVKKLEIVF